MRAMLAGFMLIIASTAVAAEHPAKPESAIAAIRQHGGKIVVNETQTGKHVVGITIYRKVDDASSARSQSCFAVACGDEQGVPLAPPPPTI